MRGGDVSPFILITTPTRRRCARGAGTQIVARFDNNTPNCPNAQWPRQNEAVSDVVTMTTVSCASGVEEMSAWWLHAAALVTAARSVDWRKSHYGYSSSYCQPPSSPPVYSRSGIRYLLLNYRLASSLAAGSLGESELQGCKRLVFTI